MRAEIEKSSEGARQKEVRTRFAIFTQRDRQFMYQRCLYVQRNAYAKPGNDMCRAKKDSTYAEETNGRKEEKIY